MKKFTPKESKTLRELDERSTVLRIDLLNLYQRVYQTEDGLSLHQKFISDSIDGLSFDGKYYMSSVLEMERKELELARLFHKRLKIYGKT